jgi:hypothetical protein
VFFTWQLFIFRRANVQVSSWGLAVLQVYLWFSYVSWGKLQDGLLN